MSSVSASDRARTTDEVRRVKEEAEAKEVARSKKQRADLKKLQEKYAEQVKEMQEDYSAKVDSLRGRNKEVLSDRDNSHQQQIDKIRNLYHEQLSRKSEENDSNRDIQRKTYGMENEKLRQTHEQQRESLIAAQREELRNRDSEVEETMVRARDEIRSSISERTKKLNQKHEREIEATAKDRDTTRADLTREMANQRAQHRTQEKTKNRQHQNEKDRINDSWRSSFIEKENTNGEILRSRDLLLQAEKEDLREKYRNRIDTKTAEIENLRNDLQEDALNWRAREMNSAQSSLTAARSKAVQENLANERLRKMERDNIVRQYEGRMQDLDRQTNEVKQSSHQLTQKRVGTVLEKADKVLQDSNVKAKLDKELMASQHREDRENVLNSTKLALDDKEKRTNQRIKRTIAATTEETQAQQQHHNKNLTELKGNYVDQLSIQRTAHMESLAETRSRMEERLRDNQVKSQKKIEDLTEFYEGKLKTMEEQHRESMNRLKKAFEQRQRDQEKSHHVSNKQVAQKYDIMFDSQQDETQKQMERIQNKHELEMANLAQRLNTKKKG